MIMIGVQNKTVHCGKKDCCKLVVYSAISMHPRNLGITAPEHLKYEQKVNRYMCIAEGSNKRL